MNRSRATMPALVLAALAAVPSSLISGLPATAAPGAPAVARPADDPGESIVVTGTGAVFGEPDTLTANFAVETKAATVGAALDSANAAATRMRDALLQAGVARTDLQTSNLSINSATNDKDELTGYTVSQSLTATIRKLPKAGALLSAAVKAGGDAARLNGVTFTIEDDSKLLSEARKKAFADAKAKAELYAREAGRPLARVVRVSEATLGYSGSGYEHKMSAAMGAADMAVPIEPGRQRLGVSVTVEWALGA
jgi:uncharacterized protein YggE